MTDSALENIDILIIGAGPVGMTLHLALAAGGQKSLLLDRRPPQAQQGAGPQRGNAGQRGVKQARANFHVVPRQPRPSRQQPAPTHRAATKVAGRAPASTAAPARVYLGSSACLSRCELVS